MFQKLFTFQKSSDTERRQRGVTQICSVRLHFAGVRTCTVVRVEALRIYIQWI